MVLYMGSAASLYLPMSLNLCFVKGAWAWQVRKSIHPLQDYNNFLVNIYKCRWAQGLALPLACWFGSSETRASLLPGLSMAEQTKFMVRINVLKLYSHSSWFNSSSFLFSLTLLADWECPQTLAASFVVPSQAAGQLSQLLSSSVLKP